MTTPHKDNSGHPNNNVELRDEEKVSEFLIKEEKTKILSWADVFWAVTYIALVIAFMVHCNQISRLKDIIIKNESEIEFLKVKVKILEHVSER